jgi:hypothetical protein
MADNHVDMRGQTVKLEDRLTQIQAKWLSDPLQGSNGEDYSSDYSYMLNMIYRLRDELQEYRDEQKSLLDTLQKISRSLDTEKGNHEITLKFFEKATQELVSYRAVLKGRDPAELLW